MAVFLFGNLCGNGAVFADTIHYPITTTSSTILLTTTIATMATIAINANADVIIISIAQRKRFKK